MKSQTNDNYELGRKAAEAAIRKDNGSIMAAKYHRKVAESDLDQNSFTKGFIDKCDEFIDNEYAKNDVRKVLDDINDFCSNRTISQEEAAALEDKNGAASKPKPKVQVKILPPAQ